MNFTKKIITLLFISIAMVNFTYAENFYITQYNEVITDNEEDFSNNETYNLIAETEPLFFAGCTKKLESCECSGDKSCSTMKDKNNKITGIKCEDFDGTIMECTFKGTGFNRDCDCKATKGNKNVESLMNESY